MIIVSLSIIRLMIVELIGSEYTHSGFFKYRIISRTYLKDGKVTNVVFVLQRKIKFIPIYVDIYDHNNLLSIIKKKSELEDKDKETKDRDREMKTKIKERKLREEDFVELL